LRKDFYKAKKDRFDMTKIPDLYDNAMYDMVHNDHLGLKALPSIYRAAHTLASYVVPQEYGIEKHDKVHIGLQIAATLLKKIHIDLLAGTSQSQHEEERVHQLDYRHNTDVKSPQRHVRTRLYFTSESHIHSLFNVLRWGSEVSHMSGDTVPSIFSEEARAKFDDMELCYLTHVVFRVLQRNGARADDKRSYSVQVLVSPGVNQDLRKGDSVSSVGGATSRSEQVEAQELTVSSRKDLTLEEIDRFISFFLRDDPRHREFAAEGSSTVTHGNSSSATMRGSGGPMRVRIANQYQSLSPRPDSFGSVHGFKEGRTHLAAPTPDGAAHQKEDGAYDEADYVPSAPPSSVQMSPPAPKRDFEKSSALARRRQDAAVGPQSGAGSSEEASPAAPSDGATSPKQGRKRTTARTDSMVNM